MTAKTMNIKVGSRDLVIETGKVAKQADGSAWIRFGDTVVLVTACAAPDKREGIDFFPLTVEYQEKMYSSGRIPGGFFKREGRPTEKETLTCRVVDRSIRPLFPEGFANETQVIATVLSMDLENDADVLALTGASVALSLSSIPWAGPLAGIRVGRKDGQFIANPTLSERAACDLDVILAASRDAIVMVEGGAKEVPEAVMVEALLFGHKAALPIVEAQEKLRAELNRQKQAFEAPKHDAEFTAKVRALAWEPIAKAYAIGEKMERYAALGQVKKDVLAQLGEAVVGREKEAKGIIEELKYEYMRGMIVNDGHRIAGRKHDEIRKITAEVGVLPRTHGSSLFTRGETQALVAATLGTREDEQRIESLTGQSFRKFMLHYNFPPYSVGEVKRVGSAGRREIGHGALAERALRQVLPTEEKFPYTIRIVSEILESNGSSSMASVCGGCLALMDAGVPINAPVAGIAMGLIKEGGKIAILSDILGDEDHLGDMDFKVCGTKNGITSIQMDIKIAGVDQGILTRALEQARVGRLHILEKMLSSLAAPRPEISKYAPRITTLRIRPERIKDVIGPGGKVIKDIVARTGCVINVEDDGTVSIASANSEGVEQAIKMVKNLTQDAEVGKTYLGTVRKIVEFGAFVEIFPGTDGLIHISELSDKRVKQVTDVLHEGDEVLVKVLSVDRQGKIRLSRKEALAAAAAGEKAQTPSA